jgi:hypothetical protein
MAVVLAVQDLCLQRAQEATTADDKLFWLYTAFYVVVNTMAFLRLSELPKCTLHGIWSHCAYRLQVVQEHREVALAAAQPVISTALALLEFLNTTLLGLSYSTSLPTYMQHTHM